MSDPRLPTRPIVIEGLDEQTNESLNSRIAAVELIAERSQDTTVIEPIYRPPRYPYDGQLEFADGVNWDPIGGNTRGIVVYDQGRWHLVVGQNNGGMVWAGMWVDKFYYFGQVVRDGGWTMICNNPDGTTDRAGPQPTGDPVEDLPPTPPWTTPQYLGVVWSGTDYTFTEPGWLQAIQVWAPTLSDDTNYRITIINYTQDPPSITTIEEPVLTADDWTTVAVNKTPIATGTRLLIFIDALNSGADTPMTGSWEYQGASNTVPPTTGGWNNFGVNTALRMHFTDLDTTDRTTEIMAMGPGTTVEIVQTSDSTRSVSYYINSSPTNMGTYAEWTDFLQSDVGPAGLPLAGNPCGVTALVPVPLATDYVQAASYWPGAQPSFATTSGYLRLGDNVQTVPNNAYGVRVSFQHATLSPDWDMVTYSESLDGSSQGGVSGIQSWKPGDGAGPWEP